MKRAALISTIVLAGALLVVTLAFSGCTPLGAGSALADALLSTESMNKADRACDEALDACDRAFDACADAAGAAVSFALR